MKTQFRFLHYFSIASFVATVIVAVVLGTFYRFVALRDLTEMAESRNVALTEAFANSIWPHFASFLTSVSELNGDELRAHPQTAKLYQAVLKQMRGLEVLKVKVYNIEGLTVFSTESSQTGENKSNNPGFLAARSGKVTNQLTHRGEMDTFEGKIENRDVISSYIPIRPGGPESPIESVLELYYDVTALLQRMNRTQGIIVVGVILILSSFYAALFFIVRRADRFIKQQHVQAKQSLEKLEIEITERKLAQDRIELQRQHLAALHEIDLAITSSLDLRAVLDLLLDKIDLLLPYSVTTLRLFNQESGLLEAVASRNIDEMEWKSTMREGGRGFSKGALKNKGPVIIANVQKHTYVKYPEFLRKYGLISYVGLPLVAKDETLGTLGFYTKEEHQFTNEEIEFLSSIADRAAIAIHNSQLYQQIKDQAFQLKSVIIDRMQAEEERTRLFNETKRNLKHISTLHAVTAAASESIHLDTVLQEAIRKVNEVFQFDCTRIFLFNPQLDELQLRASHETNPKFFAGATTFRRGQGIVGRVADTGEALIFEDVLSDPRYQRISHSKMIQKGKFSFFAVLPIRTKKRQIGVMVCIGKEVRRLKPDEIQLITSVTGQIAIAVENANLFEESEGRAKELSALYSVATVVNKSLDLVFILRSVMEKVLEIFDFDAARIYLFDEDRKELRLKAHQGFPKDFIPPASYKPGQGIIGRVFETGEPILFDDMQNSPEFRNQSSNMTLLREGYHGHFSIPIGVKGRKIGVMNFVSKESHRFSLSENQLIYSIGNHVGISIENARLYQESRKREEIQGLLKELSQDITSLDIDSLLKKLTEKVREVFNFDICDIRVKENDHWRVMGVSGIDAKRVQSDSTGTTLARSNWIIKNRRPLSIPDITKVTDNSAGVTMRRIGVRGYMGVPLFSKGGDVIGVLRAMSYQTKEFTQEQVDLIQQMANGAAIAIENARLFEQTKKQALQLEKDITERKLAEEQLKESNASLAKHEKALRETLLDLRKSHQELKAAQSQLIQTEKLESVGTLAAGVAHEVKNPLTIMLQGIHYLSKHIPINGSNVTMALQDMNDAVKRADSVVKGLLDFSASSELRLNTEELNSVVERSLSLVRHELTKYHVNAVRELSKDLPAVRLDRNKLEQVFVNIFLNAVHAMPEGGTLTVKTYTKQLTEVIHNVGSRKADPFRIGETVVMAEVEDTGTGIPKDRLMEVFDPFFTTKSTGKGTGLGLTVTKKIIDLHGGTIDIGNCKEGGARVTIMFKAQGGNDHEQETDSAH